MLGILCLTFSTPGFSEDIVFSLNKLEPYYIHVFDDCLYYVMNGDNQYVKLDSSHYFKDEQGYFHYTMPVSIYGKGEYIVIPGEYNNECIPIEYASRLPSFTSGLIIDEIDISSMEDYKKREFKSLESSKYLEETINGKRMKYEPMNLFYKLGPSFTKEPGSLWNNRAPPWVEGLDGPGIDAYINVEFNEPIVMLGVLNGFVDLSKRHLYYQNNRVKILQVLDLDNNQEYMMNFEDQVYVNYLFFDMATTNIRLIIKDVYKGSKYDDTCISAITFLHKIYRQLNNPSKQELEDKLKNYKEVK
jgi:hypothetical protein